MDTDFLRKLPKMDKILNDLRFAGCNRFFLKMAATYVLNDIRMSGGCAEDVFDAISCGYKKITESGIRRVINASGVLLHTNLGRAPIDKGLIERAAERAAGYSTLEYNLETGTRGDRYSHSSELITLLTGTEDAVVVNNNAAALFLIANTLAKGRDAVVSRGELAEIGGGFRISDMLEEAGAKLREVGSVNKTYALDYEKAVTCHTGLIMKIARSNFSVEGFVRELDICEVAAVAARAGVPSYFDAGSAAFTSDCVKAGFDIISFSGDKLCGSIQAGIIIGRKKYIDMMRRNPVIRLVRPDKLTLAILHESLLCEPLLARLMSPTREDMAARSLEFCERIGCGTVSDDYSVLGGGTGHGDKIECASVVISLKNISASDGAAFLRNRDIPVVARVEDGVLKLSLRCVNEDEETLLAAAVAELTEKDGSRI